MMSDHLGRALALMPGAYGSINNQTIVKFVVRLHILDGLIKLHSPLCGRAECFDDIEELSGINESTIHSFFCHFSKQGIEELHHIHVKIP